MQVFTLAGMGLVTLFIILNLTRKHKNISTCFLTLFFLLVGTELVYRYLKSTGINVESGWIIGFDIVYWILFGPAIYGYSRSMMMPDKRWSWRSAVHLIPLCIVMIPYVHFLISGSGNKSFFSFSYHENIIYRIIIIWFWEFCVTIYLIVTIIMILRKRKMVDCFFSTRRKKELKWLVYLTGGFSIFIITATTIGFLSDFGIIPPARFLPVVSAFMLLTYLLGIGVFGYRQEGVFSEVQMEDISNARIREAISPAPERKFKYMKSGLQDEESKTLLAGLTRLMKNEQPWMDCELNIQELAKMMNTTVHKLSRVINEHFGQNFFDFINTYRLTAVKMMLSDPVNNDQKIMAIAYDCGFNSKSAFYVIFKKVTGMSPSEYRLKNQPERSAVFSN